jgi:hypothetical protein
MGSDFTARSLRHHDLQAAEITRLLTRKILQITMISQRAPRHDGLAHARELQM